MRNTLSAALALLVLPMANAAAQSTVPVLHYAPPANAVRMGAGLSDEYSFRGFNASVQVYPFRPFAGNIQQAFQMTLLRDWIDPMHQEENIGVLPTFESLAIPGADFAIGAGFAENRAGLPFPQHYRLLIVAGNQAAIVDASAGVAQSWQAAVPFIDAVLQSLRVDAAGAAAPLTIEAGRAVAGLYMGIAPKVMSYLNAVGTYTVSATPFYRFSADGRVDRHYNGLDVPGGNVAYFDFDAAERSDPRNSGRYMVDGGKLIIPDVGTTAYRHGRAKSGDLDDLWRAIHAPLGVGYARMQF
jgi:hypothetical protein